MQNLCNDFFYILFDEGEEVCWAESVKHTSIRPASSTYNITEQFFCINPLRFTRKDSNVTAFRNILVEFDFGTREQQNYVIKKHELPYSTLVWSGNKSLHAIISLSQPLGSKEEYKAIAKAVYKKLGGRPVVDTSTSNPSRFSRTPYAERSDNGARQELLEVTGRIDIEEFMEWLGPIQEKPLTVAKALFKRSKVLPLNVISFLTYGAPEGSRNSALFVNTCEMLRAGYTSDEIYDKVIEVLDLPEYEIRRTIASAERSVNEE